MSSNSISGYAIVIAWPTTLCKQVNSWYDPMMNAIGIAKNHFYKVGHAAVVLVDSETSAAHYFDFGRYHAPYGFGRARCADTDPELALKSKPVINLKTNTLVNYSQILIELQSSDVFHGFGNLHSAYTSIDFKNAYDKAMSLVNESPIKYGPFQKGGSNCSRFVCDILNAGRLNWWQKIKLNFFIPLTPTTLTNVRAFGNKRVLEKQFDEINFCPPKPTKEWLNNTLPAPVRPKNLPIQAQWLAGEGQGSWFWVKQVSNAKIRLGRYSALGATEFEADFEEENGHFINQNAPFFITYMSDYRRVTIRQKGIKYIFNRVKNKVTIK